MGNQRIEDSKKRGRMTCVYLSDEYLDIAYEIGDKNISKGIRIALDAFKDVNTRKTANFEK